MLIRSSARYRSLQLCEWLIQRADAWRYEDPEAMLDAAQAAVDVARWLDALPTPALLMDARAEALACLGNAQRLFGELRKAGSSLDEAVRLLTAGSGDPLLAARVAGWRGALEADLGDYEKAIRYYLAAFRTYALLGEEHRAGCDLVRLGTAAAYAGRTDAAMECIVAGLHLAEAGREPALFISAIHSMAHLMMEEEQTEEALRLLRVTRPLYRAVQGRLAVLRLQWVEGRILASTGSLAEAEPVLEAVRVGFLARGMRYDAALVSRDLADVHLSLGRLDEVVALGREMHAVFAAQGVEERAVDALLLLAEAGGG